MKEDGSFSPAGPFPKGARVVIDAPLEAPFQCAKPVLLQAIEGDLLTNLAFALDGRVIEFPVQDTWRGVRVEDGGTKTVLWDPTSPSGSARQIDIRAGPEGVILVEAIRRAGIEMMEDPRELPRPSPPPAPVPQEWSIDGLRSLLAERPASYFVLRVSGAERTADILLCLAELQRIAGRRVLPMVSR